MTNATTLFPATTTSTIATDLAANMIGLLVNGANAPIERIVFNRIAGDEVIAGQIGEQLRDVLSTDSSDDYKAQRLGAVISSVVGHILRDAVRSAQAGMVTR